MNHPCPHARARGESGVALVEFALILPLLMLILLGILDFGRAFNYWLDQTHIANEGSRWAIVNTNPGTSSLQKYLQCSADTNELKNGGTSSVPDPLTVTISFPLNPSTGTSGQVGDPVAVTTSTKFNLLPFIGKAASNPTGLNLTASSIMRLEQPPTYLAGDGGPGPGKTGLGGTPCP